LVATPASFTLAPAALSAPNISARAALPRARPAPLAMLLVALVAAAPYLATIGYGFVYDDGPIIANNPALHTPAGLVTAWHVAYWPAQWGSAGLYRPVVQFIYALLWNLSGGAPWLFHLYAVALYAACAIGVLLALARALPMRAAIAGALIFAVHPLHVESVANVAGSAEIVAALASIACVLVAMRAFDDAFDAVIEWRAALWSTLLFAIALGAKESAATLPAIVALCAWGWSAPGDGERRPMRAVIARGWRLFAAYAAVLVLMIVARRLVLGEFSPPSTALAAGLEGETLVQRWWTMTAAWPLVAHLLLLPTRLSMYYGATTVIPYHTMTGAAVVAIVTLTAIAIAATANARNGDRRPLVAVSWIVLGYLAASNILIPTGQMLAERTLFFSSIGVAMIAGWALARAELASPATMRAAIAVAIVLMVGGAASTAMRVPVWSSEERLFQSGIDFDPAASYPYEMLARVTGQHGDNARGLALLGEAYRRYPAGQTLALEYAQHLRTSGRGEDALTVLRATEKVHPASQPVRLAYLDALLELRGADSLIREIEDHRGADAAGSLRYVLLANAYEKLGKHDSVTAVYGRAVAEDGDDPGLRYAYASALHASHREADAQRELDSAAASGKMPPVLRYALQARIALAQGDSAGARGALARARALAPQDTSLSALDSALSRSR
jgi:Flp pilus assembly protein TadD